MESDAVDPRRRPMTKDQAVAGILAAFVFAFALAMVLGVAGWTVLPAMPRMIALLRAPILDNRIATMADPQRPCFAQHKSERLCPA